VKNGEIYSRKFSVRITVLATEKLTNGWKYSKEEERTNERTCCGHASTVSYFEVKEQIDYCIRVSRKISVDKILSEMSITHGKRW